MNQSKENLPHVRAASRHHDAMAALELATERIQNRLTAIVEQEGISLQQFRVLRILREAGEHGVPTLAVARRLVERAPGVTRLADRLERRGLLRRERGRDRRQVVCLITPEGLALLAALDPLVDPVLEAAFAPLTLHELPALIHLLNRIRNRLR